MSKTIALTPIETATTFRIAQADLDALRDVAAREHRSVSSQLRLIVEQFLTAQAQDQDAA